MSASRSSISPGARSIRKSICKAPSSRPRARRSPPIGGSGQVNIADVSLPIAGAKLRVASAVKLALDGMVR
jgi:hypothetical protein